MLKKFDKTYEEQQKSIRFYRIITALLSVIFLVITLKHESENDALLGELTAQVKAHEKLSITYDTLNRDVVSGSCLLRSQL